MKNESVAGMMKDLGVKLSALAEEFDSRSDLLTKVDRDPAAGAMSDDALADRARDLLSERRLRRKYLPDELFHEPAWDMLIALFVAHTEDRSLNIKALVSMADAPVTTSQRWIEHLHKLKLIDRVIDPADRRRVEVSLNHTGYEAIKAYLQDIARS